MATNTHYKEKRFEFMPLEWQDEWGLVDTPYNSSIYDESKTRITDAHYPRVNEIFQDTKGNLYIYKIESGVHKYVAINAENKNGISSNSLCNAGIPFELIGNTNTGNKINSYISKFNDGTFAVITGDTSISIYKSLGEEVSLIESISYSANIVDICTVIDNEVKTVIIGSPSSIAVARFLKNGWNIAKVFNVSDDAGSILRVFNAKVDKETGDISFKVITTKYISNFNIANNLSELIMDHKCEDGFDKNYIYGDNSNNGSLLILNKAKTKIYNSDDNEIYSLDIQISTALNPRKGCLIKSSNDGRVKYGVLLCTGRGSSVYVIDFINKTYRSGTIDDMISYEVMDMSFNLDSNPLNYENEKVIYSFLVYGNRPTSSTSNTEVLFVSINDEYFNDENKNFYSITGRYLLKEGSKFLDIMKNTSSKVYINYEDNGKYLVCCDNNIYYFNSACITNSSIVVSDTVYTKLVNSEKTISNVSYNNKINSMDIVAAEEKVAFAINKKQETKQTRYNIIEELPNHNPEYGTGLGYVSGYTSAESLSLNVDGLTAFSENFIVKFNVTDNTVSVRCLYSSAGWVTAALNIEELENIFFVSSNIIQDRLLVTYVTNDKKKVKYFYTESLSSLFNDKVLESNKENKNLNKILYVIEEGESFATEEGGANHTIVNAFSNNTDMESCFIPTKDSIINILRLGNNDIDYTSRYMIIVETIVRRDISNVVDTGSSYCSIDTKAINPTNTDVSYVDAYYDYFYTDTDEYYIRDRFYKNISYRYASTQNNLFLLFAKSYGSIDAVPVMIRRPYVDKLRYYKNVYPKLLNISSYSIIEDAFTGGNNIDHIIAVDDETVLVNNNQTFGDRYYWLIRFDETKSNNFRSAVLDNSKKIYVNTQYSGASPYGVLLTDVEGRILIANSDKAIPVTDKLPQSFTSAAVKNAVVAGNKIYLLSYDGSIIPNEVAVSTIEINVGIINSSFINSRGIRASSISTDNLNAREVNTDTINTKKIVLDNKVTLNVEEGLNISSINDTSYAEAAIETLKTMIFSDSIFKSYFEDMDTSGVHGKPGKYYLRHWTDSYSSATDLYYKRIELSGKERVYIDYDNQRIYLKYIRYDAEGRSLGINGWLSFVLTAPEFNGVGYKYYVDGHPDPKSNDLYKVRIERLDFAFSSLNSSLQEQGLVEHPAEGDEEYATSGPTLAWVYAYEDLQGRVVVRLCNSENGSGEIYNLANTAPYGSIISYYDESNPRVQMASTAKFGFIIDANNKTIKSLIGNEEGSTNKYSSEFAEFNDELFTRRDANLISEVVTADIKDVKIIKGITRRGDTRVMAFVPFLIRTTSRTYFTNKEGYRNYTCGYYRDPSIAMIEINIDDNNRNSLIKIIRLKECESYDTDELPSTNHLDEDRYVGYNDGVRYCSSGAYPRIISINISKDNTSNYNDVTVRLGIIKYGSSPLARYNDTTNFLNSYNKRIYSTASALNNSIEQQLPNIKGGNYIHEIECASAMVVSIRWRLLHYSSASVTAVSYINNGFIPLFVTIGSFTYGISGDILEGKKEFFDNYAKGCAIEFYGTCKNIVISKLSAPMQTRYETCPMAINPVITSLNRNGKRFAFNVILGPSKSEDGKYTDIGPFAVGRFIEINGTNTNITSRYHKNSEPVYHGDLDNLITGSRQYYRLFHQYMNDTSSTRDGYMRTITTIPGDITLVTALNNSKSDSVYSNLDIYKNSKNFAFGTSYDYSILESVLAKKSFRAMPYGTDSSNIFAYSIPDIRSWGEVILHNEVEDNYITLIDIPITVYACEHEIGDVDYVGYIYQYGKIRHAFLLIQDNEVAGTTTRDNTGIYSIFFNTAFSGNTFYEGKIDETSGKIEEKLSENIEENVAYMLRPLGSKYSTYALNALKVALGKTIRNILSKYSTCTAEIYDDNTGNIVPTIKLNGFVEYDGNGLITKNNIASFRSYNSVVFGTRYNYQSLLKNFINPTCGNFSEYINVTDKHLSLDIYKNSILYNDKIISYNNGCIGFNSDHADNIYDRSYKNTDTYNVANYDINENSIAYVIPDATKSQDGWSASALFEEDEIRAIVFSHSYDDKVQSEEVYPGYIISTNGNVVFKK